MWLGRDEQLHAESKAKSGQTSPQLSVAMPGLCPGAPSPGCKLWLQQSGPTWELAGVGRATKVLSSMTA